MRILFLLCVLVLLSFSVFSQESSRLQYSGDRSYTFIERTDLRRYDNNKYVGLVSREVSSFIIPMNTIYEGSFFVTQDTIHSEKKINSGIHDAIPSKFRIDASGQLTMVEDYGYPSFRSFPSYTNNAMHIGDKWQAKAERAVDPLNKGVITKIPMFVEYTYVKDDVFHDEPVYV
ncbi:MAG: hypothetical protein K6E51_02100, partial [Treponema sp.]|nr:hypothetical protein [Treponema sp.]